MTVRRCKYCNEPLPPKKRRGPPADYCGPRCRTAAHRDRVGYVDWAGAHGVDLPAPAPAPGVSPDEQVARTLLEVRSVAGSLKRLSVDARPAFAWRCARLGDGINDLVDNLFGGK